MKNATRFLGIIALAAVIGFSMAACENPIDDPPVSTLIGITAAYNDNVTAVIYPATPHDSLKEDLTVTAYYSNYASKTLRAADYTLSGTLAFGANTLTVAYEGKTTTLTVMIDNSWNKWVDSPSTATLDYSVDDDGVCTIIVGGNSEYDIWKTNAYYRYTAKANTSYTYVFEAWTQEYDRTVHVQYYDDWSESVYLGRDVTLTQMPETYTIKGQPIPKGGLLGLGFQCADQTGTFYVKILEISEYTPSLKYELIDGGTAYRVISSPAVSGAVEIPSTYNGKPVREIGKDAFNGGRTITSVTIPASVTTIGSYVFGWCTGLTSITIPASVTSIGGGSTFAACTSLTSITVPANNPNFSSQGGILYNKNKTTIIAYPSASGNVTIPISVTAIGSEAFRNTNITSITIPASVTSIDYWAFAWCTSPSITLPASVTSVNWGAFNGWTSSQTIYIKGYSNQQDADNAWGEYWRYYCNANIVYQG